LPRKVFKGRSPWRRIPSIALGILKRFGCHLWGNESRRPTPWRPSPPRAGAGSRAKIPTVPAQNRLSSDVRGRRSATVHRIKSAGRSACGCRSLLLQPSDARSCGLMAGQVAWERLLVCHMRMIEIPTRVPFPRIATASTAGGASQMARSEQGNTVYFVRNSLPRVVGCGCPVGSRAHAVWPVVALRLLQQLV